MPPPCARLSLHVSLLADDRLPAAEAESVKAHLADCAPCRGEYEALIALRDALARCPTPAPAADALHRLHGTLAQPAASRRSALVPGLLGLGVAAGALVLLFRTPPRGTPQVAAPPALPRTLTAPTAPSAARVAAPTAPRPRPSVGAQFMAPARIGARFIAPEARHRTPRPPAPAQPASPEPTGSLLLVVHAATGTSPPADVPGVPAVAEEAEPAAEVWAYTIDGYGVVGHVQYAYQPLERIPSETEEEVDPDETLPDSLPADPASGPGVGADPRTGGAV